jgi:hypothetical protein
MASSLRKILELDDLNALDLKFTLPGSEEHELKKNGRAISVDKGNRTEYVTLVTDALVGNGIKPFIDSFFAGFTTLVSAECFKAFSVEEIEMLIAGDGNYSWTTKCI